jgi:predicted porin
MAALGQGNDNNKYYGGRLGFASGPFDFSGGYGETTTTTANKFKLMNFGGTWNFGFMKLYALWNEGKLGGLKEDFYDLSVGVPLGQGEFKAAFAKAQDKGTQGTANLNNSDATLWGIQYIYNLSKRTALYGGYASIDNDPCSSRSVLGGTIGSNTTAPQVGNCAAATTNGLAGKKSDGFNIGVRHSF